MASAPFSCGSSKPGINEKIAVARNFLEDMNDELDDITLWKSLTTKFAGKSREEIEGYCNASINEFTASMLGLLPTMDCKDHAMPCESYVKQETPPIIATDPSTRELIATLREGLPDQGTTKGHIWSNEEHSLFLLGMKFCGKGDWKSISKYFVLSRTPTQIASHAQKFFTRKEKPKEEHCPSTQSVAQVQYLPIYVQNGLCQRNVDSNGQHMMMPMPFNMHQAPLIPPTTHQRCQYLVYYPNTGAFAVQNRNVS